MYKYFFKRVIDLTVSIIILILTLPLWFCISIILFIANDGKIFFKQKRVGKNNVIFYVLKFKSMNDKTDINGNLLKDIDRLTPIGKFVRKTSIDELPQLINVLKGDMSIIGPRPLLVEYLPYYNSYHIRRHEVRPGITGLAQVEGRNQLTFGERFNLDVEYVDNLSFINDLKIFLKTILKVLLPKNDIQLGKRPLSQIDDIGITKGLDKHYFNVEEDENK